MEREYKRYLLIKKILNFYPNNYEYKNIVERWIISLYNIKYKQNVIFTIISINNPINQKFINELIDKNIFNDKNNAEIFVNNIVEIINNFLQFDNKILNNDEKDINIIIKYDTLYYKNFKYSIYKKRMNLLFEILKYKKIDNPDQIIGIMLMRYASLANGGQQWNIPYKNYKYLYDKYNARIEGFASPINSQLIEINYKDINFCSLFHDTDHYFGSLGNFFDINVKNKTIIINPPYIEQILADVVNKIFNLIEDNNLCIFTMPHWSDSTAFELVKKHAIYYEILYKNKYYYEDSIKNKKIIAKFNSVIAVFNKNNDKKIDYSDIAINMKLGGEICVSPNPSNSIKKYLNKDKST